MAKSAIAQLQQVRQPKRVESLPEGARHWGPPGASMIVSTPAEVDSILRQVPAGRVTTLDDIRQCLARRHGTTIACPVSTAIFIGIAARAALEMRELGTEAVTPFWRALRSDGSLNPKYPGGIRLQAAFLEAEGHRIGEKGKSRFVEGHEAVLADLA
ncbi:MAG: MGMT family protein [Beijerinckiaceae bacterium]|nr:MGMT family protein [Beijerinckiaceae bacterium]